MAKSRLYWGLWVATTILTGVLAGFLISHSIMFGRFFSWFIESGNLDLLHRTYTVFRAKTSANNVYNIPFLLQLIVGISWVTVAFILKRARALSFLAGLSTVWVGILFIATGLGRAEDQVLSAKADPATTQLFLSINVPLHSTFAVIYSVCFLLLLLIPLQARHDGRQNGASALLARHGKS